VSVYHKSKEVLRSHIHLITRDSAEEARKSRYLARKSQVNLEMSIILRRRKTSGFKTALLAQELMISLRKGMR
jgi:hypothetical protein